MKKDAMSGMRFIVEMRNKFKTSIGKTDVTFGCIKT
jgi:hypothetical protein